MMHIPKTAGDSLQRDVLEVLHILDQGGFDLAVFGEECWDSGAGARIATMLRRPRSHVLSMYSHCTEGEFAEHSMPASLGGWVREWLALRDGGVLLNSTVNGMFTMPFRCYSPINMQSQRFTCRHPYAYPRNASEIDVGLAIQRMHATWFVGLMEAYRESLCLLHEKLFGVLPSYCNCADASAWASYPPITRVTHKQNNQSHTGRDLGALEREDPRLIEGIDDLTALDRALYGEAVKRFIREAREVERRHGQKFLCIDLPSA